MRQLVLATVLVLASLVALAACDPNIAPTGPSPTSVWVNVTREQYEQALAKWLSQGIEEYEARVEYHAYIEFMGIWTLRVRTAGDHYEVIDYTREPGLGAPLHYTGAQGRMPTNEAGKDYLKEQLKYLTIEGQFKDLGTIVSGRGVGCFDTEVTFDPQLGNPTNIEGNPTNCSHGASWELKSLKILKQREPTSPAP